jgi:hypothetical protein
VSSTCSTSFNRCVNLVKKIRWWFNIILFDGRGNWSDFLAGTYKGGLNVNWVLKYCYSLNTNK